MPRLPYLPEDLAEPRDVVDAIRKRRGGRLGELDRMLLHCPPVAMGWNSMLGSVRSGMTLPAKLREMAMCVVGVLNGAEYEWVQHAPLLEQAGASPAQMAALRDPQSAQQNADLFDATERAALAVVIEMTRSVKVSDASFAALRAVLPNDQQVFELIVTAAAYNMVSRVLVATGVEPE